MKTKLVFLVLLVASFSCARPPAETKAPTSQPDAPAKPRNSTDVVKVSVPIVNVKPSESSDVLVQVVIDKGYHVNANPPTFPYLKATELQIVQSPGVTVGKVSYPDAITRTFAFAEKPLAVYEGTIEIKASVRIDKNTKPGAQRLPAKLRVQACDEEVCYAPGTLDVAIPLDIQ